MASGKLTKTTHGWDVATDQPTALGAITGVLGDGFAATEDVAYSGSALRWGIIGALASGYAIGNAHATMNHKRAYAQSGTLANTFGPWTFTSTPMLAQGS